ncbi:protein NODULATION SIGNALING PATHWAY 2-like [Diospyros lotus]|uniref:protein NODULATION SIGNALING PATHWAY 2-like n=1 Tax=Diospyros lotus TaxID=55363 RepID=UPI00224DD22A|nr:protein NODULATION SIGNALING PATHWAY 2-like [Diospyros lotus]
MLQPEVHQSSSLHLNHTDEVGSQGLDMDRERGNREFSSWFLSTAEDILSPSPSEQGLVSMEESGISSSHSSSQLAQKSLIFPKEDMELDKGLSILHLLKALGEAMENENKELERVILKRLEKKANLNGAAIQRLVFYLIQSLDKHLSSLTKEAIKNYEVGFRAFYQIFPYGRFAHFIANSLILEALPGDAETIHILDFDMGEGVQWAPLIEALGKQSPGTMRLVSIKCDNCASVPPLQNFEKTQKRLCEHAHLSGLELKVEEMDMDGLASEMKKMKMPGRKDWFAFNCMVGLPHMGRVRSARLVTEFLKVAEQSINASKRIPNSTINGGILTFGHGHGMEEAVSDCCDFGSTFEQQLSHVTALLESMEWQMPFLEEARTAMECLFMAPFVSSLACFEKLEERACPGGFLPEMALDPWRVSNDVILEAKQLVREGNSPYWIRSEGQSENQVLLCFLGTPLVRVSSWS